MPPAGKEKESRKCFFRGLNDCFCRLLDGSEVGARSSNGLDTFRFLLLSSPAEFGTQEGGYSAGGVLSRS